MVNLKNFFTENKKPISVLFSVIFSILIVVVIVHGATTIGTYIATGGDINASGTVNISGGLNASGTFTLSGNATTTQITPWANNTSDLGDFGYAWKDIYASGTIYSENYSAGAAGTSTFVGGSEFVKTDATTTISISDHDNAISGRGGCIALGSTSSTQAGVAHLYLFVQPDGSGALQLATSTTASDCY